MRRIVWSEQALDDLADIGGYLAGVSPAASVRFVTKLMAAANGLDGLSERGRKAGVSARELVGVRPYVIRYVVLADEVRILSIRHSARRPLA